MRSLHGEIRETWNEMALNPALRSRSEPKCTSEQSRMQCPHAIAALGLRTVAAGETLIGRLAWELLFQMSIGSGGIDNLAANHGQQRDVLADLFDRLGHVLLREHGQVRELPRFERSA